MDKSKPILGTYAMDLTGKRFLNLTVLGVYDKKTVTLSNGKKRNIYYWKCKCDCGKEVIRTGNALRRGATKSCGCKLCNSWKGR